MAGKKIRSVVWAICVGLAVVSGFSRTGGVSRTFADDVIDRLMAIVVSQPILLSDVNAAMAFQLVQPPPGSADPVAGVLDRLIDRTLILAEVERYQPPEPAPQEIDARFTWIERRAGTPAALDQALSATGMTRDGLRQFIRDDLRIVTYLNQRFGVAAQPSDDEVLAYYREHPEEFSIAGALQPFQTVAETIRARLVQARRTTLIADWLATLRRRADVTVLYVRK